MNRIVWKKEIRTILILTFIGFLVRLLLLLSFSNQIVFGPDQIGNVLLARDFASGNYGGFLDVYWAPVYPFLIGVISLFTDSLQTPSLVLGMTVGALTVPAVYILARKHYRFRVAVVAATLAVFNPHLLHISVFDFGSESTYLLLMLGAVYFGFEAIRSERSIYFAITGIFLALSYLTRPEAIGYFVAFLLFLLIRNIFQRPDSRIRSLKLLAVLCMGFFLFAAPYLIYLKADTGDWIISAKVKNNVSIVDVHAEKNSANSEADDLFSIFKIIQGKRLILNAIRIDRKLPELFPIPYFLFAAIGLFFVPWNRWRFKWESFLIVFCLLTVVCYLITIVHTRYFFVLLPVLFGWISLGISHLHMWTVRTLRKNKFLRFSSPLLKWKVFVSICLILIFLYTLPLYRLSNRNDDFAERDAGLWLKKNGKPSAKIFSVSSRPAFYAEGIRFSSGNKQPDKLLSELRNNNVDYVVSSSTLFEKRPDLHVFEELVAKTPDFELIYQDTRENPSITLKIFRKK